LKRAFVIASVHLIRFHAFTLHRIGGELSRGATVVYSL
jgi:hypothetical protein